MHPLEKLPFETISLIFQSCDAFSDVLFLASTCRSMQAVWLSESTVILWEVGFEGIIGFQNVLSAICFRSLIYQRRLTNGQVRATTLVEQAHEQGVLPPNIRLQNLAAQHPSLEEWKKILNLRHLVRCFERIFLSPENGEDNFYTDFSYRWNKSTPPSYWKLWTENFHMAAYRTLTIEAVLSRAYQEPFFSSQKPEEFLKQFTRDFEEGNMSKGLTPEDVDLKNYEDMSTAYDSLTDWLLEDCKSQILARNYTDFKATNNSRGPLFREICRIMISSSHLWGGAKGLTGPTRTVASIPLGEFQVHEIEMPASVQDVGAIYPFRNQPYQLQLTHPPNAIPPYCRQLPTTRGPKIPMLSDVLYYLYQKSGKPNRRNPEQRHGGHPTPEPPLQIFEFILRKQFNLVFHFSAFERISAYQPSSMFDRAGDIFGIESENHYPIESAVPPPAVGYSMI